MCGVFVSLRRSFLFSPSLSPSFFFCVACLLGMNDVRISRHLLISSTKPTNLLHVLLKRHGLTYTSLRLLFFSFRIPFVFLSTFSRFSSMHIPIVFSLFLLCRSRALPLRVRFSPSFDLFSVVASIFTELSALQFSLLRSSDRCLCFYIMVVHRVSLLASFCYFCSLLYLALFVSVVPRSSVQGHSAAPALSPLFLSSILLLCWTCICNYLYSLLAPCFYL